MESGISGISYRLTPSVPHLGPGLKGLRGHICSFLNANPLILLTVLRTRSRTLSTSYRAQDGISIMKRRVSERESICDPIWDVVGEEEQLIPEEDSTCWSLTNPVIAREA